MYTIRNVAAEAVVLTQPEFDILLDLAHPVRDGEAKAVYVPGDHSKVSIEVAEADRPIRYRGQDLEVAEATRLVFSAVQIAYGRV